MQRSSLSRRAFLKASLFGLGSLYFPHVRVSAQLPEFPEGERLGRVIGGRIPLKLRPDIDSPDAGTLYEDDVVIWLREITGRRPLWNCQRFVETPEGFVYAPNLQPVRNETHSPLEALPEKGLWVEVSVPYVDLELANPPARSPWLKDNPRPRLYYSQVLWVDQRKAGEQGQVWYRAGERYGTFGDFFWVPAAALRPLAAEEIAPLHPEVEDKRIVVDLLRQSLSAFEGKTEVYYCQVSTGGKYDKDGNPSDKWSTPVGEHTIWRKLVSVHMTGGTAGGGYDIAGIGWTVLFSTNGVALHSTFWHNNFGAPMSHGCVNLRPEDARWLFRWTNPPADYEPGDLYSKDSAVPPTKVRVVEG
jgi:hypothetical protein